MQSQNPYSKVQLKLLLSESDSEYYTDAIPSNYGSDGDTDDDMEDGAAVGQAEVQPEVQDVPGVQLEVQDVPGVQLEVGVFRRCNWKCGVSKLS